MYYHASSVKGITQLTPQSCRIMAFLWFIFPQKRENVLVYLSNSIEKYCAETGFSYDGKCQKWGPYGFGKDGRQRLEEYYPNALISTYKGVSGYIYSAETISDSGLSVQIPDVATSSIPVDIYGVEFIPDAYEAILQAEQEGLLTIIRYEEMNDKMRAWNKKNDFGRIRERIRSSGVSAFLKRILFRNSLWSMTVYILACAVSKEQR